MTDTAVATPELIGSNDSLSEWGKMTPEQRDADADRAVAAVHERHGIEPETPLNESKEPKEPEQIKTDTPAENEDTPVSSDAASPKGSDKSEGEEGDVKPADDDWLDQDTRDFAGMMGLTDDDLSDFGSREELERALRIIDRRAFEAGKTATPPRAENPPPVKPVEKPIEKPVEMQSGDHFAELASFKLDEELSADDAPKISKAFSAVAAELQELRAWRNAMQQQQIRQEADNIRQKAVDALHSLGNAELFGKPGERITKEQAANIEKAIDAHFTHARGLIAQGRQVAPTKEFLKAAVHLAFGDQLSQLQQKQLTEKLRKQSSRRTGGGATKPLPQAIPENETQRQMAARIANDPDVASAFNKLLAEQNG